MKLFDLIRPLYETVPTFKQFWDRIGTDILEARWEFVLDEYRDQHGYQGDDRQIIASSEFQKWFKAYLKDAYHRDIYHLTRGPIEIYRSVSQTPDWLSRLKPGDHLGVYWSSDYEVAIHWRSEQEYDDRFQIPENGINMILQAIVPPDSVDWEYTMSMRLGNPDEQEVRIITGRQIQLVRAFKPENLDHALQVQPGVYLG